MAKDSVLDFIDNQISRLVKNAPDSDSANATKLVAPVLKTIALSQKYPKYFVLQSPTGNLLLTTLRQISNPKVSKNVIYAYPSEAIARQNQEELSDAVIKEFEIIPLLFQLLGMPEVDSLIFDDNLPKEIERQKLYDLCQIQLKVTNNIA